MISAVLMGLVSAYRAMRRNVLRATLTILGLLIGVAAVVTIAGIALAARNVLSSKIEVLGSNLIIVFPQAVEASGAKGRVKAKPLTDEDIVTINREASSVAAAAPMLTTNATLVNGDRHCSTILFGSTLAYFSIRDWRIARGDLWTKDDEVSLARVVVLGATTARRLFGHADPIGNIIRVGNQPHVVIAVMAAKGDFMGMGDQDDVAVMPIGSMRLRVDHGRRGDAGGIIMSATSASSVDHAVAQTEAILRQRHEVEKKHQDFDIKTMAQVQKVQGLITALLTAFLLVIASISLVVGGIGVMNIMLVSVAERTREIGIRLAIGARAFDVQLQFLLEAVALSLVGGVLGALIGWLVIVVAAAVIGWPFELNAVAVAVGIGMSVVTGVVFGFAPARRAARLDPIQALRYE
jgi:putative ABC transport system permease protein